MSKSPIIPGVYVLKFGAAGMVYVGASLNVHRRVRQQMTACERRGHVSPRVQSAWDVDGGASLLVVVRELPGVDALALQGREILLLTHWVGRVGWHRILNVSSYPLAVQRSVSQAVEERRSGRDGKRGSDPEGGHLGQMLPPSGCNPTDSEGRGQLHALHLAQMTDRR